jgi:serine/threonine-protein kinase
MSGKTADHLRVIEGGDEEGRAPSAPPPDPLVGRTIDGRYLIEAMLGEGGMGIVYRARHAVLNKPLAIKVLRPEVSKDEEIITRFRQEAQSASAIGSEHIIDISDFGTLPDGSTYFVMEFLNGKDLTTAIEEVRPMPDQRVVHIAKQLCQALGAAHSRGIVHRDLKPDNIYLIRRRGDPDFVKVLDFGIAKVGSGTKKLTKAGQVFGTPHYMSPEQCAGTGTDHRTDIYAMGVILYEMTAGKVPFDADNLMGILTKHMYEQPVPLHTLPPPVGVSPSVEAVILKCLEKQADIRYQTMEEVHEDLVKIEQGLTPQAVLDAVDRSSSPGARRDATGRHASDPATGMTMRVGDPGGSRLPVGKLPLIAAALAAVGLVAVVLAIALGGSEEPEPVVTPPVVAEAPEPEPEPEQPQMEESGSTETEKVTISSDPAGVEVWLGDELIGNAPVEIPRPQGDERVELTLRMAEYNDQPIRISSLTAESVRITLERNRDLERERERDRARVRRTSRENRRSMREEAAAAMEPAMEPPPPVQPPPVMVTPMRTTPQSEVIDPWG